MFKITPLQRTRIQIAMFQSIYKANLSTMGVEDAFCRAIVLSRDEIFDEALENRPELIQQYLTPVRCKMRECRLNTRSRRAQSLCTTHDMACTFREGV